MVPIIMLQIRILMEVIIRYFLSGLLKGRGAAIRSLIEVIIVYFLSGMPEKRAGNRVPFLYFSCPIHNKPPVAHFSIDPDHCNNYNNLVSNWPPIRTHICKAESKEIKGAKVTHVHRAEQHVYKSVSDLNFN